jgi:Tfp pilus assembly protein PilO
MRSNFRINVRTLRTRLKEPRIFLRVILGLLLLANLVAAAVAFKPWAGSQEDLEREAASLRKQVHDQQAALDHLKTIVNKVKAARTDGDKFLDTYLLSRRTAASNLTGELYAITKQTSIRQAETDVKFEPIEGTDDIAKALITVNYQGTYADLMQLLSLIDRSPRFLIVESLRAAPQQTGQMLNILMKVDAFVREGGPDQQVEVAAGKPPEALPRPAVPPQAAPVKQVQATPAAQASQPEPAFPAVRGFASPAPGNQPPATPPRRTLETRKQVIR